MQDYNPKPYQIEAERLLLNNSRFALFLCMGLGKTAPTISAVYKMMYRTFQIQKVLVIAPKRVAESVWIDEAAKWSHIQEPALKVISAVGLTAAKRTEAMNAECDICCLNVDNVLWLAKNWKKCGMDKFDCLILDESSLFKNPSKRTQAMRKMAKMFKHVYELTGTPAAKSYMNLWSQINILDGGQRLGTSRTGYRDRYFDFNPYTYDCPLKTGGKEAIQRAIQDITFGMNNDTVLQKPVINDIKIKLTPALEKLYNQFKKDSVLNVWDNIDLAALPPDAQSRIKEYRQLLEIETRGVQLPPMSDEEYLSYCSFRDGIIAKNAASLSGKLLQFASGAIYNPDKTFIELHTLKIEALQDIVDDAQGNPILVAYNFKHELDRLQKAFPKIRVLSTRQDMQDWNAGKIELLAAQPQSVGHGLNIQQGGHIIVWFSLTFDLELYEQFNARLNRTGQTQTVIIHRLIVSGTRDNAAAQALSDKAATQKALIASLGRELFGGIQSC